MCDETSSVMDQPNIRNGSEPMAETFNTERLQKDLTAVKNDISALTEQLTDVLNSYADKASKQARQGYKQARSRADSLASDWSGVASDWQDRGLAAYEDARDAALFARRVAGRPDTGTAARGGRDRSRHRFLDRRSVEEVAHLLRGGLS